MALQSITPQYGLQNNLRVSAHSIVDPQIWKIKSLCIILIELVILKFKNGGVHTKKNNVPVFEIQKSKFNS